MALTDRTCNYDVMNVERLFARLFVVAGGIFWIAAFFGAAVGYRDKTPLQASFGALLPLAIVVAVFVLGWFFEKLAAVVLWAGSAAVVVWGAVAAWEPAVWVQMVAALIGPMLLAGALYWLAARMQTVCELKEGSANEPRPVVS